MTDIVTRAHTPVTSLKGRRAVITGGTTGIGLVAGSGPGASDMVRSAELSGSRRES